MVFFTRNGIIGLTSSSCFRYLPFSLSNFCRSSVVTHHSPIDSRCTMALIRKPREHWYSAVSICLRYRPGKRKAQTNWYRITVCSHYGSSPMHCALEASAVLWFRTRTVQVIRSTYQTHRWRTQTKSEQANKSRPKQKVNWVCQKWQNSFSLTIIVSVKWISIWANWFISEQNIYLMWLYSVLSHLTNVHSFRIVSGYLLKDQLPMKISAFNTDKHI